eukprot:scaffold5329_cov85-Skeletonema_menzelii.AAC.9
MYSYLLCYTTYCVVFDAIVDFSDLDLVNVTFVSQTAEKRLPVPSIHATANVSLRIYTSLTERLSSYVTTYCNFFDLCTDVEERKMETVILGSTEPRNARGLSYCEMAGPP